MDLTVPADSIQRPVMIILTGGRSTPAVLGALTVKPRAIEFINSRDEAHRQDEVVSALKSLTDVALPSFPSGETIDAYDMDAAYKACASIVERIGDGPFVINLSSGTKVMALGAYEFARQHRLPALYVDTNARRILDLTTKQDFSTIPLRVDSYLACYGRSPEAKFNADALSCSLEQAIELAGWLVAAADPALSVLELVRRYGEGKGKRTCKVSKHRPDNTELHVWNKLVSVGLLERIDDKEATFSFTLPSDVDFEFLKGTWLEMFVWHEACNQRNKEGAPVFDDALFNFEIPSDHSGARKEIDVGLMVAGQMIHCSCKAGGKRIWSTDHLDELRAVSSLIGGRFCSRVFITSKNPPAENDGDWKDYQLFLEQAKDRQIVVIAGDKLPHVGACLARQASNEATYRRI